MSLPGDDAVWARLDELPSRLTAPATASVRYEDQKAAAREAYESSKEAVSLAKDDLLQIMLSTHEQLRALESDNGRPTRPFEPASAAQDTEALMAEAREYNEDLTVGEGIGWLNNDEEATVLQPIPRFATLADSHLCLHSLTPLPLHQKLALALTL